MDKVDYVVLLKSMCKLKQRIDELADTKYDEINATEIKLIRNYIERVLKNYPSNDKLNTGDKMFLNLRGRSSKSKMAEFLDVASDFCTEIDRIKSNLKQNMSDDKKCQKYTNDDDSANKRQNVSHEKCESKLKFYEEYVNELECRLRGVIQLMTAEQLSDQKHSVKDNRLKMTLLKMKSKERHNKAVIQNLSKELNHTRKISEERQKKIDEVVSKIGQLKRIAEKNVSNLARSLSSIAVDLSDRTLTAGTVCEELFAVDDDDDIDDDEGDEEEENATEPCEIKNKGNDTTGRCRTAETDAAEASGGFQTFRRPISHRSPTARDRRDAREVLCRCSTVDGESNDDDHPTSSGGNRVVAGSENAALPKRSSKPL